MGKLMDEKENGHKTVKYNPYPEYKDSGVDWLGEIPIEWDVLPLKNFGRLFKGNGGTKADECDEGLPCIRYGHLYTRYQFFINKCQSFIAPESAFNYTEIKYGDILLAASGETLEDIGKSAVNLLNSRVYCGGDIIVFRPTCEIDPVFIGYASDSEPVRIQKANMGRGYTVVHIYPSNLRNLEIVIPTLPEQLAIADFLDRETSCIDAIIEKKKRLIVLLKEKRTVIITQAVTKGLDPNVPMKDSGVEWLGKIPKHWKILKLRRIVRMNSGHTITSDSIEDQGDYPVYGGNGLRGYTSNYTHEGCYPLIGRQGALCGCVNYSKGKYWASEHAVVVIPYRNVAITWLGELLRTMNLNQYSVSAAQPGLAIDRILSLQIPVPRFEEQQSIADFLDCETSRIDSIIEKCKSAISLYNEHRSALISAAVTGKIDVRALA